MSLLERTVFILTCALVFHSSSGAHTRERRQSFFDYFNFPGGEDEDTTNSTNSGGMNFDFTGNSDWDNSIPVGPSGPVDACSFMCDFANSCGADEDCVVTEDCTTSCVKVSASRDRDPDPLSSKDSPTGNKGNNPAPGSPPFHVGGVSDNDAESDSGSPKGNSFNFGGDSSWGEGAPVPVFPSFPLDLPDESDTAPQSSVGCVRSCDLWEPCAKNQECLVTPAPDCKTICRDREDDGEDEEPALGRVVDAAGTPTASSLTTAKKEERTRDERECEIPGIICHHGTCENMVCDCEEGWTGTFCEEKCSLTCENGGVCLFIQDREFCNCPHKYEGDHCESLIPDPEEKTRALAGGLSAGLAIALLLLVVTPIILWRKRNTFVLKLVYYFKEYEDHDGMTYDAYVSLTPTSKAELFVYRSLQPKLEKLGFKLFLQARDGPVGGVMAETIIENLEKSRRTILIITHDYVSNEWNRFERLIAHQETLKLHQRIIPIILENPDKETINKDKSLKHILASVKCLKFPQAKPSTSSDSEEAKEKETRKLEQNQEKFWKRLELTMPKKRNLENSDPKSQNANAKTPPGGDSKTIDASQGQTQNEITYILSSDAKKLNGKHALSDNFFDLGTNGIFKVNQDMRDSSQVYGDVEI